MPCLANRETGADGRAKLLEPLARRPRRGRRSSPTSTAPWRRSSSGPRTRRCRRRRGRRWSALSERFGLVGCVSGRRAEEARRLVGLDGIAYAGNHGLELLLPGDEAPRPDPSLAGREARRRRVPRRARRRGARRGRAAAGGQGADPGAALARRRGRGRAPRASAHEIAVDAGRGRAGTALGTQGAGAAPGRRRRQGRRGRLAAGRRGARPPPSTPATTAPTSTPSAACASCARKASWRPRSASASSRRRRRRSCPKSPT